MPSYGLVQLRWIRNRPSGEPAEDVAVNTLHCQVTDGGWTTDDRDTFKSAWDTLYTALRPSISADVGLAEMRMYNVPVASGPLGDPVFVVAGTGGFGTGSAAAELPPQVAMSVTWITAIRRRWGRIYLPGLVNSVLTHGRFASSTLTTIGNAIDAFGTALRGSGQGIVVWHRASWTPQDVTTFRIDDVPDVQRRRRFGHSVNVYNGDFTA